LVSLDTKDLFYISARINSNTQLNFLEFVVECVRRGYLTHGNTLVCDNASVYRDLNTLETLLMYLEVKGVQLVYFPAYSPKLNSCELVFSQVKRFLRENKNSSIPLLLDIAVGFAMMLHLKFERYYNKYLQQ
jgi:transposase